MASPYFTPRGLKRLDEIVDVSARSLVDELGREGECDFIRDVASLHPLRVLAHILGVPREDEPFILKLTNELFGAEDPEFQRGAMQTPEERQATMRALGIDFFNYFNKVMESRRAKSSDDLASVIANARVDGQPMNMMDTMGYCLIVFTAGHETTRGGIGGGMLALLENPLEPVQCEKRQLRRQMAMAQAEERGEDLKKLRARAAALDRNKETARLEKRLSVLEARILDSQGRPRHPEDLDAISLQQREAFYRCE